MMDVVPTVAKLCGSALPAKPLDGIDIWPLLNGEKTSIDRDPLLYFDNWDLQCARMMNWKLHVARHNTGAYMPAPRDRPPQLSSAQTGVVQSGDRSRRELRRRCGEPADRCPNAGEDRRDAEDLPRAGAESMDRTDGEKNQSRDSGRSVSAADSAEVKNELVDRRLATL